MTVATLLLKRRLRMDMKLHDENVARFDVSLYCRVNTVIVEYKCY